MIDLKQFIENNWVLVSGYINWDKNFNVYNGYTEPTEEQKAKMISDYSKSFNSKISLEFVTYKDEKSIQWEIDRQVKLKQEIDAKATAPVKEIVKAEESVAVAKK